MTSAAFSFARLRTACLIGGLVWCLAGWPEHAVGAELQTTDVIPLARGRIQVSWLSSPVGPSRDLLIHFHGSQPLMAENFIKARIDGVLVTVNFNGLSSVYADPFRESPQRFQEVLDRAMAELRERGLATDETRWRRVCVSSFSAGYGAVREILKTPESFQRIDGLLAADSIYAGLEKGVSRRQVNQQQMRDFREFARLASEGKKTFVVTHSYLETPYASTFETADDLLQFVAAKREAPAGQSGEPLVLRSRAEVGHFTVLGYAGNTGEAHMDHLRHIATWWRRLPLKRRP